MIRILVGRSKGKTRVVYCGDSGVDCQAAIDANWDKFDSLEQGELPVMRRARRSQSLITPPNSTPKKAASEPTQAPNGSATGQNKEASATSATEGPVAKDGGAEGPSLV